MGELLNTLSPQAQLQVEFQYSLTNLWVNYLAAGTVWEMNRNVSVFSDESLGELQSGVLAWDSNYEVSVFSDESLGELQQPFNYQEAFPTVSVFSDESLGELL